MFSRISTAIAKRYSLRLVIALLLVVAFFFWLFNFSSLPVSNPELRKLSSGEGLLDLRFYYTAQEAYRSMERYGNAGRALYVRFLAADFFFLPAYGFAFSLLFTRLAGILFGTASPWIRVNLLPLGIALADFVENICLLVLLISYPERNLFVGTLAGIATLTKQALTAAAIFCLAAAALLWLAQRFGITPPQMRGNGK